MTAREKIEAEELKIVLFSVRGGVCEVCGKELTFAESQLAHRIGKGKVNRRKYGNKIIDHFLNMAITCSDKNGRCNDSVNIAGNPGKVQKLLNKIEEELNERGIILE